jgi:hypothetical protein
MKKNQISKMAFAIKPYTKNYGIFILVINPTIIHSDIIKLPYKNVRKTKKKIKSVGVMLWLNNLYAG